MDTLERSIHRVSGALAFSSSDAKRANRAYARWRNTGSITDKKVVDIWTYCRVGKFFQRLVSRYPKIGASDRDMLVETALSRIGNAQASLRSWDRYAAWVSVVCKNVFCSYCRRSVRFEQSASTVIQIDTGTDPCVRVERRQQLVAVLEAIEQLPPFLGAIVRMRYLDGLGYAEISARTGKPVATIRVYASRSLARIRSDPRVAAFGRGSTSSTSGLRY